MHWYLVRVTPEGKVVDMLPCPASYAIRHRSTYATYVTGRYAFPYVSDAPVKRLPPDMTPEHLKFFRQLWLPFVHKSTADQADALERWLKERDP